MKKIFLVFCFLFALCITATAKDIQIASDNMQIYEGKTYLLIPYGQTDDFTFTSDNPAVAPVDATGLVRGIAPGKATIMIKEAKTNAQKTVAVMVKEKSFAYSLYCPPTEQYITPEQFAYMEDVGINTVIMSAGYPEETMKKYLKVASPFDISFIVNDERSRDIVNASDETIASYVNTYKDYDNVIGYYIKDEPLGANPYAPVYRKMADLYPDGFFHLNFYPTGSVEQFGITYDGYIDDWISLLGPNYKKTISFDNYPFSNDHYNEALCMYHFDIIRKYARKHDVDFEYFVQSSGLETGYQSNENSVRYHFSIGLAYGAKSYQYFTWFTPLPTSEPFIPGSAIMTSDGKKGALYEIAKDTNARARKVEPYLAPAEAIDVYHTGSLTQYKKNPPKDFFFQVTNNERAIVSLYHNEAKNVFYIFVVNKNYTKPSTTYDFSLEGVTEVYDLTSGTTESIALTDGKFSATIEGGLYRLYTFQKGFTIDSKEDKEDNLALGMPAYVSTSVGNKALYAHHLTDGDKDTLWSPDETDEAPYVLIDLKAQRSVGAVHVKAAMDYAKTAKVSVSRDNVFFNTVAEFLPLSLDGNTIAFDARLVRYIKIELPKNIKLANVGAYEKEPLFLSYAVPHLEDGTIFLKTNGNFENHHIISVLYQDERPVKVRILAGEELKEKQHMLFDVPVVQNATVKSFLMQLGTLVDTCTIAPETPVTVTETFDDGYNDAIFATAVNGSCSFDGGKMSGFAFSFGTKGPVFIQAGYTFCTEIASPAREGYWNAAGVSLRADKVAAPYYLSQGILLFFSGDKMGIRTRSDGDWINMMAENQTMMPLPVSFETKRKVSFRDNGSDTITISSIGDDGAPVLLGEIVIDQNGATLYNAEKTASYGTVPASMLQKAYVGVFSHSDTAFFDNIELTYNRRTTKVEAFDTEYDQDFWLHTASKEFSMEEENLKGLAFSFGTKEPLATKNGYILSMDIAAPYDSDTSPAMSAGIVLRSKKLASTHGRGKGIILLIQEDRIGLRTVISRSKWTDVIKEDQSMLPIPVNFKTLRRLVVRDNGDDEIRISSYDDTGKPVVLGYVHITPTGATLFSPDKKTAYGTLDIDNFENEGHVGICQYLSGAVFDNISLSYAN